MAMAHSERGCMPFAMPQSLMWKRNAASRIPRLHSFPLFRFILPVLFSVFLVFLLSTLLLLALQLRGQRISWTPRIPYQKQQAPFSPSQSLPLQLRAARYGPYVPHFYKLLTHWLRNKRYKPSFMKELLKIVKFPLDSHYRRVRRVATPSEGKRYASCAVVGNSGILLRQRRGSFIDKHDMVLGLNNADTKGYEAFVGSKTTLAFVNSNIFHDCRRQNKCQCQYYGETVAIIMYICQVLHFMDVAICSQQIKAPLLITEARFDGLCTRIVKYYSLRNFVKTTGLPAKKWNTAHDGAFFHYSSGMQAVMLALGICEKVSILGFGKASNASHHYHSRQAKEIDIHDYAAEYLFYNDLVHNRTDIIPFLKDAGLSIPSVHIYD